MIKLLQRSAFNFSYLAHPRWDTGIPAPELVRFLAGRLPGNAIDIGCGTGTNLLYMAEHQWQVTGVDFAPLAIEKAKRKLKKYSSTLLVADVTKLAGLALPGSYDLALDMGCFHALAEVERGGYVSGVEKQVKPLGMLMIYAFQPAPDTDVKGIAREVMVTCFRAGFNLFNYEQGQGRPSAWYYFQRREHGQLQP